MTRRFDVEFTSQARKQLLKLDSASQARIVMAAALLAEDPRPPSARQLVGATALWRVRVAEYRLIYRIFDDRLVVAVARVGHRSCVYRRLNQV